jgi:hypothetical protein
VARQRHGVRDYFVDGVMVATLSCLLRPAISGGIEEYSGGDVVERSTDYWWNSAPAFAGRITPALGIILRDGAYLRAVPWVGASLPAAAVFFGFIIGWRHPLASDLFTTSLFIMLLGLLIGCFSAAVGVWFLLGYAFGDLFLATRDAAFNGAITNSYKTWVALILCDGIFAILVVVIPLTARLLAGEVFTRWFQDRARLLTIPVGAAAAALLAFAWSQSALVLTRPYFAWHGLSPSPAEFDALRLAAWVLPLIAAAGTAGRYGLEEFLRSKAPELKPLPEPARPRKVPVPVAIVWRVALSVFLLAGLMESWIDPIVVAAVMVVLIAVRDPTLRRFESRLSPLLRLPVLPRLAAGAAISAIVAIILISALGSVSAARPVVISTLISLIVLSVLLPDHVLERPEHGHGGGAPERPPAPPALSTSTPAPPPVMP